MQRWCREITAETGVPWKYAKVPYGVFHGRHFAHFEELARALEGPTAQLVLPEVGASGAVLSDPADGPPAAVVASFWRTFGDSVPAAAVVLASTSELDPRTVRTALDQSLPLQDVPVSAFLFFVDLQPEANWAHACSYAFVSPAGEAVWCEAEWPPEPSIRLALQHRP
jgi:hypothetical protein